MSATDPYAPPASVTDAATSAPEESSETDRELDPPLALAYRIERVRLRTRIVALERALEVSDRRRQSVIDSYEHALADRDAAESAATPASDGLLEPIRSLVDRVR